MGKVSEISALLAAFTTPPLPTANGDDLIDEMTVFPLPRYPKFSLANLERDLHQTAPSLKFRMCDLSFDSQNEPTDGFEVQRLCITFQPAADPAVAAPLVMQAIRAEYDRKGMRLDAGDLSVEYKPDHH